MFVKAFVIAKKNQLRMQFLIKIVLTFNFIKINKKTSSSYLVQLRNLLTKLL